MQKTKILLVLILFLITGFVVFRINITVILQNFLNLVAPLQPNPESIIASYPSSDGKYKIEIASYEGDATSANEITIRSINISTQEKKTLLTKKVFTGADLHWNDSKNF